MQNLRLFCDVADLGSFSKAALRHGITQSAVSQRIRQLEKSIGGDLLDRSVRPFQLTPAGQLLLDEGRDVIRRYDELMQRARSHSPAASGSVRVAAIYSAGIGLLEGLRARFEHAHPGIEVLLEYQRPEEVAEAVRTRRYDLGIISYPNRWPELKVRRLRDEEMCVVCSAEHALAARKWVAASSLSRFSMAGFETSLPVGRHIRRYLRENAVSSDFAHVIDNIDTIKSLLGETQCIAILPRRTVLREVELGSLATVGLRPKLSRPMGLVTAKGQRLSPAAEMFGDFLVQHGQAIDPLDVEGSAEPSPTRRISRAS